MSARLNLQPDAIPGSIDLTAASGAYDAYTGGDWSYWRTGDAGTWQHKGAGDGRIGDPTPFYDAGTAPTWTIVGGGRAFQFMQRDADIHTYYTDTTSYSYTSGMQYADRIYDINHGFRFTIKAGRDRDLLRVFLLFFNATVRVKASISDGSSADATLTRSCALSYSPTDMSFALDFQAERPDSTVTLEVRVMARNYQPDAEASPFLFGAVMAPSVKLRRLRGASAMQMLVGNAGPAVRLP